MYNKHSVYFESKLVSIASCIALVLVSIFLIYLLIKDFYIGYFFTLLVIILVIILLVQYIKYDDNGKLSKILVTDDSVIFFINKDNKLILPKSDIQHFEVEFGSDLVYMGRSANIYYDTTITITKLSDKQSFYFTNTFQSKSIIKSIFKIAKYIPNFSYKINKDSIPVVSEDINKIARCGKSLNLVEFLNFMITNPNVSIYSKIETIIWIIIIPLLITFISLMIFNMELADKIALSPLFGPCFINELIPLVIIILVLRTLKECRKNK